MNTNDPRFELIRRCRDGEASTEELAQLESCLREDADFRQAYVRYINLDVALSAVAKAVPMPETTMTASRPHWNVWLFWRPLSAAAAGIVLGTFCTSLVFGFVARRGGGVKKVPLAVFDPGLESTVPITARDIPGGVGAWGVKSGRVVEAENGVEPREGRRMLRLEPVPRSKQGESFLSSASQMFDLRPMARAIREGDAEVQVTASFRAADSQVSSLYSMRILASRQPPDKARSRLRQRTEDEGVAMAQETFGTAPGEGGWHTFSLKMPLPRGARTLVIIFAAGVPKDATVEAAMYYLDDVQVSVITPEPKS